MTLNSFSFEAPQIQRTIKPIFALVAFENTDGCDAPAFTYHPVVKDQQGQFALGAGKGVTHGSMRKITNIIRKKEVSAKNVVHDGLLPSNVLLQNADTLIWFTQPQLHTLWFSVHNQKTGIPNAPLPALLYVAHKRSLRVFALGSGRRPQLSTKLFHAPFMNIDCCGKLCVGSAHLPKTLEYSQMAGFESAVLDSNFTHTNHDKTLKINGKELVSSPNHLNFWHSLTESTTFPRNALRHSRITLNNVIETLK